MSDPNRKPNPETREEKIARLEADGRLVRDCEGCAIFYAHPTLDAFAPHHQPSARCRCGKRPHCTCDTCF